MKEVFVQAIVRSWDFLRNTAKRVDGMMAGWEAAVQEMPTMSQEDLSSPRARAAMRIVDYMNSCIRKEQLEVVAKMIDLFERKYDDTLPLRAWWRNAMFNLTYYPKNAC